MEKEPLTLFLSGDVMPGRGVDQILPRPLDPVLHERYIEDARAYVALAEKANGPIPIPVGYSWPWGDALRILDEVAPDVRLINLETSVTRASGFAPGKAVHYRMSPGNVACLTAATPDACVLANNHVLDFGIQGLEDTLDALSDAGILGVGAGRNAEEARRPGRVTVHGGRSVLVLAYGSESSGIPPDWAATANRPGVSFLPDLSERGADEIAGRAGELKQPGDVVVVSLHWGSNWGYHVDPDQIRFAHRLIDSGVDMVHGHSSHHPRPIEVYRDKLILYGCGDLLDDYEGITGYERYRDDLRLLYFAAVAPESGALVSLRMVPMQTRQMRLRHASTADADWLQRTLDRVCRRFGTGVECGSDGALTLRRS